MLYAINEAIETAGVLGRIIGRLEGERWEAICRFLDLPDCDPTLVTIEAVLFSLAERARGR